MSPAESATSKAVPPPRRELVAWMRGVSRYGYNPHFVRALTDVSFEVRRGDVFGLLGPAGSGKSTVIRILAGRLSPSEGKARVFGHSPWRLSTRARVGYLPQNPIHARSRFLLKALGLLSDLFRPQKGNAGQPNVPAEFAGKERHVLLMQALLKNPDLVLLDEPFAGLDLGGCNETKRLIRALAQQGRTVILSSGSLAFTKDICDRVAVLSQGQIAATGTLEQLLATTAGLRHLVGLLPQPTAERVLEMIRHDMGTRGSPSNTPLQAPERNPPGVSMEPAADAPDNPQTAADATLVPLLKAVASDPGRANEFGSTVNHEMLAALAKSAANLPASLPEAKPKPSMLPHG